MPIRAVEQQPTKGRQTETQQDGTPKHTENNTQRLNAQDSCADAVEAVRWSECLSVWDHGGEARYGSSERR